VKSTAASIRENAEGSGREFPESLEAPATHAPARQTSPAGQSLVMRQSARQIPTDRGRELDEHSEFTPGEAV
jgi:hypothetical protein